MLLQCLEKTGFHCLNNLQNHATKFFVLFKIVLILQAYRDVYKCRILFNQENQEYSTRMQSPDFHTLQRIKILLHNFSFLSLPGEQRQYRSTTASPFRQYFYFYHGILITDHRKFSQSVPS